MLASAAQAQPAIPAYSDGAHLLRSCAPARRAKASAACQAYISGVIDYVKLVEWTQIGAGRRSGYSWCEPSNLGSEGAARLVVRRLTRNPEDRAKPAAAVVFLALAEAFPCAPLPPP